MLNIHKMIIYICDVSYYNRNHLMIRLPHKQQQVVNQVAVSNDLSGNNPSSIFQDMTYNSS